jgi:hypothetical protein
VAPALVIDPDVREKVAALDPAVRRQIERTARWWLSWLARAGEPVAADEAIIWVHDALTDTLVGKLTWNHAIIPLKVHLYGVIKRRCLKRLKRAKSKRRMPLVFAGELGDDEDDEGYHAAPVVAPSGESAGAPEVSLMRAQVVRQLYDVVRLRAGDNTAVLALLDAYLAEEQKREQVMEWARLSLSELRRARKQLDRIVATLPVELRSAVADIV